MGISSFHGIHKNPIIILSLFILVFVLGFISRPFIINHFPLSAAPTPKLSKTLKSNKTISVQGVKVCLPNKESKTCIMGFKDIKGQYYSLADTDSTYKNINKIPTDTTKKITLEGIFISKPDTAHESIGTIAITAVKL